MFKVTKQFQIARLLRTDLLRTYSQLSSNLQELFVNPQIHNLLRLITYTDSDSVHQRTYGRAGKGTIKLLSDAELNIVKKYTAVFTEQKLQMPPVLNPRTPVNDQVIAQDLGLQGIIPGNVKLVFTDTTLKRDRKDRLIVVRESNGNLRHANAFERDRINQVYFPLSGRKLFIPLMFEEKQLNALLDQGSFLYVLDRTCVQFEPDDPNFSRICHRVYERVNQLAWTPFTSVTGPTVNNLTNPLLLLRHTRHYGPLALYMIAQLGSPGPLVYEALAHQNYDRLGWILRLICILRPSSPFAVHMKSSVDMIPPPIPNAVDHITGFSKINMSVSEINDLLEYLELFIKLEPLGKDKQVILNGYLQQARKSIKTNEETNHVT
ncbi:hypothetical protein MN116_007081 [Schistosoma mekongi]|uniref:28S ribosomal protein S22 n=1 Tax=Schistosoma mekongi TaxID=38744 RepID=A0AAE2D3A2_SCHME|nr:hypothetical protein MN116_007081 [Schistosoma mekongi]